VDKVISLSQIPREIMMWHSAGSEATVG
jgi:hypothetical protein